MRSALFAAMLLSCSPLVRAEVATEVNKALVRDVFRALESGDLDTINRAFDPAGQSIIGTEIRPRGGPHKTFAEAAPFPAALDDRKITIEQLLAEGDMVAVRSQICGTHARPLSGFAPSGKTVCARYLNLYTFKDGRIVANAVGVDRSQMRQWLDANATPIATGQETKK